MRHLHRHHHHRWLINGDDELVRDELKVLSELQSLLRSVVRQFRLGTHRELQVLLYNEADERRDVEF